MIVDLFEARNKLSGPIRAARAGEEVVIANRGVPVARLVPVEEAHAGGSGNVDAILASLDADPLPAHMGARNGESASRASGRIPGATGRSPFTACRYRRGYARASMDSGESPSMKNSRIPARAAALRIAMIAVAANALPGIGSVFAASDSYAVEDLEYAGARLGFTAEQTVEALSESLGIDAGSFAVERHSHPVSGLDVSEVEEVVVSFEEGDLSGTARFYPDIGKSPISDSGLTYLQIIRSSEDQKDRREISSIVDEMIRDVTDAIGSPSFDGAKNRWCVTLNDDNSDCADDAPSLRVSMAPRPRGGIAVLENDAVEEPVLAAIDEAYGSAE